MEKFLKWCLHYIKFRMAQKSLPILNKVNTSMIWYSTYYCKYYKWLSSQNLYLSYFFNKLFIYLDFFFINLLWIKPYTTYMYNTPWKLSKMRYSKFRYLRPVTSYLVTLGTKTIFFNIYYKTSLEHFQSFSRVEVVYVNDHFDDLREEKQLSRLYFT